jgi:hypothetical protein
VSGPLAIYSGSCGTLTQVSCNFTGDTLNNLTVGNTYYVRYMIPSATSFTFCITTPPSLVNDECAGAIAVPVNAGTTCTQTVSGTTTGGYTTSAEPMSCGNNSYPDVWYTFTATSTQHTIALSAFSNANPSGNIVVYSGTCGALTQVSCFTGSFTAISSTVTGLTVGTTYYLRIGSPAQNFDVCITTPPPANDECAGAITAPVNADANCTQTIAGTTIGTTASAEPMPCATNSNPDVWYTFTATNTDQVITLSDFSTTNTFANIGVYSGTCSSLVQLSCSVGVMSTTVTGLTVGTTYYLRVRTPAQNFTLCIAAPLPPITNDECAGAISVPVNANATCTQTLAATMVGATASPDPLSCFATGTLPDVWFTFTASGSTHNISTPPFTVNDSRMAVYSGNCGALTEVYCGAPNATVTGLTAGSTYYVRILSITTTTFNVCVSTPAPLPVSLSELKGHISNGKAILDWNTYSEHVNKGFDVMRSEDGKTFRAVGWIPSQAANGNSEALLTYTFTDAQAIAGKTFYQLRQVDIDGKTALSNVVALSANQSDDVVMRAYPNPVKNLLNIDITGKTSTDGHVTITDIMGKTVINHTLSSNTATIDLGALPAGVYFVKYANSTTSTIQKIVKK